MIFSDYGIEATRAIYDERLREADHARLVKQFGGGLVTHVIGIVATLIVAH